MIAMIGTNSPPKLAIHSMSPTFWNISGGADRDRTGGLLVANQALSQLSYSPNPVVALGSPWQNTPTTNETGLTTDSWWAWVELNYRPHPYQGCALAN